MNNTRVLFPFRKAEALFYYLLLNGQASRDELVNLLWGELEEETAKKNLRNAIYKIKKAFDTDILVSPKKSVVMVNPAVNIETDLALFNRKGKDAVEAYQGPFLKGFLLKDGDTFEEWMLLKRTHYQERYVKILYEEIEERRRRKLPVDELALALIEVNEFDERAYRILMRYYADLGLYNKAVELHERLCRILEMELGVQPEGTTTSLHLEIMNVRSKAFKTAKTEREAFFYGRRQELAQLNELFNTCLKTRETRVVIILGEAGIGKTRLKDVFLKQLDVEFCLLEANCYQAEEEFLLKPWYPIFSKLVALIKDVGLELPELWVSSIAAFFPSQYSKLIHHFTRAPRTSGS
jgi:DNA-binding SARP family transcriptional activator